VDRARDLASAGQVLEALSELTQANRRHADAAVEEELVGLRHAAFDVIDRKPAVGDRRIRAQPPQPGGLPELTKSELTVATLRHGLATHGCVLVRGLITSTQAVDLTRGIDRALAACDAGLAGAARQDTTPWFAPFEPASGEYRIGGRRRWMRASGGMWTVDSPRMLFELLEVFDATGIAALVADHFGERPVLSANKCNLRRVPVDTSTNWHQDGAFLGAEVNSVNVWLGLSHCGVDAPGLDIVPQRVDTLLETGTEGAIFDWSVGHDVVSDLGVPVLRPELGPGDALLFDHLFLHRTGVDPGMTRERYAIESWFFAPSSYPEGQIPIVY
jgi:hypothetical protein